MPKVKSSAFQHFHTPQNEGGSSFKAKCKHCSQTVSGSYNATSNLLVHIKRHHPDIYKNINQETDQSGTQPTVINFLSNQSKWKPNHPKQQQCTNNLIDLIAEDLLPLSFVESKAHIRYVDSLNSLYVIPSRKHLSNKLLPQRTTFFFNKVKDLLASANDISITVDIWSSRDMRSYIGITCHYILDFTLKSSMLCCRRFRGSHTGKKVSSNYDEIVDTFEISHKVSTIITDNAANMFKAFVTLPELEILPEDETDYDSTSLNELEDADPNLFKELPTHYSCFAHTLQLVIKDGLKEAGQIAVVTGKVSRLVSHVRHSSLTTELLENDLKLQMSNATRWNSQLQMIRSLLRLSPETMVKIDKQYNLSKYEISVLKDLCEILSPFETATDLTQGQNIVTASLVIPCIRGLRAEMEEIEKKHNYELVQSLKASINKRLSKYEEMEIFKLSAALDPRFKLMWCTDQEKVDIAQTITKKIQSLLPCVLIPVSSVDNSSAKPSAPKKRPKLFRFMGESTASTSQEFLSHNQTPQEQLKKYLQEPCLEDTSDPLQYWRENQNKFPQLQKIACKFLATPASSAPVERIFSVAGKIFRPDRCSLSDSRFEELMFIRCNR